ncbi:YybH family protein [Chondrinema litorale]|uniref:YybH family protein n=1 Tax=Chondrinema litorale TaxID=2994555 RepID=UPI0025429624|nr:nuclear transport factor 2 family protein [Chondrinema litorale]UZR93320.1 nuclear transport factor 2 family protein [Chondrinema litorale]
MKLYFYRIFCTLLLSLSFFYVSAQDKDIDAVKNILQRQIKDWNSGDVEKFMVGYWESEKLKFVGSNGVTYGYEATLERYKTNYPNQKIMGKLDFDIISTEKLAPKVILVVGKFHLTREVGDAEGYFTLTWKKIDGKWVIIVDHTG